jgi:hypothetical protein
MTLKEPDVADTSAIAVSRTQSALSREVLALPLATLN